MNHRARLNGRFNGRSRGSRRRAAIALSAGVALLGWASFAIAQAQGRPIPNTVPDPNVTGSLVAISPEGGLLVAPGPPPGIILLFTGRVIGYVEPCG